MAGHLLPHVVVVVAAVLLLGSALLGHPPTGRRFEDVDEVCFFRLAGGRIVEMWGLEDTADRLRQLGLA